MTQVAAADFTAALDVTTLWIDEGGVWTASGGVLTPSSANFRALLARTALHAALANCDITFTRASATFDGGVLCRANISGPTSAVGDSYIYNPSGTQFEVIRRIAGVNATLAGTLTGLTANNGDVWRIRTLTTAGDVSVTFDIYQNGNLRGQIVDAGATRILVPGQTGFITFNVNSRFDNYVVDNLLGAGVVMRPRSNLLRMAGNFRG